MKKETCILRRIFLFAMIMFLLSGSGIIPISEDAPLTALAASNDKSAKLNVKEKKLLKNQTFTIKVYRLKSGHKVRFRSKNSDIVSITNTKSKQCTIKAEAIGDTKIIATIYNTKKNKKVKTLKCRICVTPPAVSVRFKTSSYTLKVNDSINLSTLLTLKPKHTAEVPVFSVSDKDCLRVSPNGFAKALEEGTVTVTATISNGKSDHLTVYIEKDEDE